MQTAKERIQFAYDPKNFRESSVRLTELLTEFLAQSHTNPTPALPWTPPEKLVPQARAFLDRAPLSGEVAQSFGTLAQKYLANVNRLHSPHYMGHQVPPPIPVAGLFDALGSVSNQGGAVFEMGPFSSSVERAVIEKLGGYFNWPKDQFDGIATHGGSLANLTGVLAARNVRYPEAWEKGMVHATRGKTACLITSADSHYSVARSAGVLGVGTQHVLKAELGPQRRIDPVKLELQIQRAELEGKEIFALVGSACTTATGSFDNLEAMADLCRRYGIWFHVDGAHGASFLMSDRYRYRVKGIEQADTVVWDAHKMLFLPALLTFLFYKNKAHSYQTFAQDAPYLFDAASPDRAQYDSAVRTIECTKRAMVLGLWGVWSTYGPQLFSDLIDTVMALTETFHGMLKDSADFVALHEPQANILCFRYLPKRLNDASPETISLFQQTIRLKLIESGRFYITGTKLDGVAALRVTLINPLTETSHLAELLVAIRELGDTL